MVHLPLPLRGARQQSSSSSGGGGGPRRPSEDVAERNRTLGLYAAAVVCGVLGISYAAVPLYQMFCQATGYGGTTQKATEEQFKNMKPVRRRGVERAEGVFAAGPLL
jgi:hypothetical protein